MANLTRHDSHECFKDAADPTWPHVSSSSLKYHYHKPRSLTEGQGPPNSSPIPPMGREGIKATQLVRQLALAPCLSLAGKATTHFLVTGEGGRAGERCWPWREAGLI